MGTIEVLYDLEYVAGCTTLSPFLESNGCIYHLLIDNGSLLSFRYCQYMFLSIHLTEEPKKSREFIARFFYCLKMWFASNIRIFSVLYLKHKHDLTDAFLISQATSHSRSLGDEAGDCSLGTFSHYTCKHQLLQLRRLP